MININLLPIEAFRHKEKGRKAIAIYVLSLIAFAACLAVLNFNVLQPELDNKTSEKTAVENQRDDLSRKVETAKTELDNLADDFMTYAILTSLEEARRFDTTMLYELSTKVPNDNAWLVSFSQDKDGIALTGMATDNTIVAKFLDALESCKNLKNVSLVRTASDVSINQMKLTRFEISGKTNVELPKLLIDGLPECNLPPMEEIINRFTMVDAELLSKKFEERIGPLDDNVINKNKLPIKSTGKSKI